MGRMVKTLIFSKDRPAQLDLCIRSFKENFPYTWLSVLYTYSSTRFLEGYDKLRTKHKDVRFILQNNFKNDVVRFCEGQKLIQFATDDDIVYAKSENPIELMDCLDTFSLRLGLNTYVQNPHGEECVIFPEFEKISRGDKFTFLKWNMSQIPNWTNFGYKFSVDGGIYCVKDLRFDYDFKTPNFFEADMKVKDPFIAGCFMSSVIVNSPTNRVQHEFTNNAGLYYPLSAEEMNERFLSGQEIKLGVDVQVKGAHQELELEWV